MVFCYTICIMKKLLLSVFILGLLYVAVEFGRQRVQNRDLDFQNQIAELERNRRVALSEKDERIIELETENKTLADASEIYTVVVGGDLMFDRGVEAGLKKNEKGYDFLFEYVSDYLNEADLVFANLEGSMSDIGTDTGKKYSFRFEPAAAPAMSLAGFDVLSLANNHMLDWGRDSLCATIQHLKDSNLNYVGAGCDGTEAEAPYITTLGNTKIALLAYTEFYKGAHATDDRAGMSHYDMGLIAERVQDLKENQGVDVVMVSMHWGEEYLNRAPERIVDLGQEFVDMGVDVVIGHHPHVDQEIERYGDGWIIYSLGNFVFDQSWSEETMQGLLAEIKVQNKRVYDIVPVPIQLNNVFQPQIIE